MIGGPGVDTFGVESDGTEVPLLRRRLAGLSRHYTPSPR